MGKFKLSVSFCVRMRVERARAFIHPTGSGVRTSRMKRIECWIGIVVGGAGVGMIASGKLPVVYTAQFFEIVIGLGAALLGAGLVRDLWILARRLPRGPRVKRSPKPMCVESVLGATAVALGLVLMWLGVQRLFDLTLGTLAAHLGAVLYVSGWIKDLVFVLEREENHGNVILW